jgi:hypothetical protein
MARSATARVTWWKPRIMNADTGEEALNDAWRWLRSELSVMAADHPADVDDAKRDLAEQMATNAELMPKYKSRRIH